MAVVLVLHVPPVSSHHYHRRGHKPECRLSRCLALAHLGPPLTVPCSLPKLYAATVRRGYATGPTHVPTQEPSL